MFSAQKFLVHYKEMEAIYFNNLYFDESKNEWMAEILPCGECSNETQLKRVPYRDLVFADKKREQTKKLFFSNILPEIKKDILVLSLLNDVCLN